MEELKKKRDAFYMLRSYISMIREMDAEDAKEYVLALGDYALDGIKRELKGAAKIAFQGSILPLSRSVQNSINGKKGGAKKGNQNARKYPKVELSDTDFTDVKTTENNQKTSENNQNVSEEKQPKTSEKQAEKERERDKEKDFILKEKNSQYINTQLPKESLEVIFRNELKKNDNRKWITDSSTFEISLYNNKEFREWVSSTNCDNEELRKIWDKFRVNYLSRVSGTKEEVEIPNIEIEDNSKNVETKKGNAPVEEVIDVSEGTNKEIYDYLKENKSQGLFKGSFYTACCHNSRGLGNWMYENGYDKEIVEKIFNQIDREAKVSR